MTAGIWQQYCVSSSDTKRGGQKNKYSQIKNFQYLMQ
jgi:hypothetical protein